MTSHSNNPPCSHISLNSFSAFSSLSADDFSSQENLDVPEAGGWDAILSTEDEDEFFDLQIVKHYDGEVGVCLKQPP